MARHAAASALPDAITLANGQQLALLAFRIARGVECDLVQLPRRLVVEQVELDVALVPYPTITCIDVTEQIDVEVVVALPVAEAANRSPHLTQLGRLMFAFGELVELCTEVVFVREEVELGFAERGFAEEMPIIVQLARREHYSFLGKQLLAQVVVMNDVHLVGVHVRHEADAVRGEQARRLYRALVRVGAIRCDTTFVVNLFRSVDGQEHRRDPAVGNELGFGLTDDVRVRQHHRIVTDTMFIGPCNELFGERSHLIESE